MAKAILNGTVIAESDDIQIVEGNYYFPPESVKKEYLKPSDSRSICPWKGIASYYDVEAGGEVIKDGAWYYPQPKEAAKSFGDYVSFWRGVEVEP
jgi:uncharacterized protein (DUF427 family)